jgi:spermidine/putrescine transport system permease protein
MKFVSLAHLTSLAMPLFVVLIYAFLYLPVVVLILFSFNSASFPAPWTGFTLAWYGELFSPGPLWNAVGTSLLVATLATTLVLLLTLALMLYLYYQDPQALQRRKGQGAGPRWLSLFYANALIPEIVLAVGLLSFYACMKVPLGIATLSIAHAVLGLGFALPIIYTRLTEIDHRVLQASLDLGATPLQTFFRIVLPLLRPSLIAAGLLVFILSFDDFVLSYFCAGSSAQTLSLYILAMLRTGISPVINALSTLLLCITAVLVAIYCSVQKNARVF